MTRPDYEFKRDYRWGVEITSCLKCGETCFQKKGNGKICLKCGFYNR